MLERTVSIAVDEDTLEGYLAVPDGAAGLVIFAHGTGSTRVSPRIRFIADVFNKARLAALLLDLLTQDEEQLGALAELRLDIGELAARLSGATQWASRYPDTQRLPAGYFGASTGSAAAVVAAARRPDRVGAVVSAGGRPDLAGLVLAELRAATLLIVGEKDPQNLLANRAALDQMSCERQLAVVPGATWRFEEPGALDQVAILARDWFLRYLVRTSQPAIFS